jgi:hypothetical protein
VSRSADSIARGAARRNPQAAARCTQDPASSLLYLHAWWYNHAQGFFTGFRRRRMRASKPFYRALVKIGLSLGVSILALVDDDNDDNNVHRI